MLILRTLPLLVVLFLVGGARANGVVVEQVRAGGSGAFAGFQKNDVVIAWRLASQEHDAFLTIEDPYQARFVDLAEAPKGPIRVQVLREGQPTELEVACDVWRLNFRPNFNHDDDDAYSNAKTLADDGDRSASAAALRDLAVQANAAGDVTTSIWFHEQVARTYLLAGDIDAVSQAFDDAVQIAESSSNPTIAGLLRLQQGSLLASRGHITAASEALERALETWTSAGIDDLGVAACLRGVGGLAVYSGDYDTSRLRLEESLEIYERVAPISMGTAHTLNNLGVVSRRLGDFDLARGQHARALEIQESLAPAHIDLAVTLNSLGNIALQSEELGDADEYYRRALSIQRTLDANSPRAAMMLDNIGLVAKLRGQFDEAEVIYLEALEVRQATTPGGKFMALTYGRLGELAHKRGQLATAEYYYRQSLELREQYAPGSMDVATSLYNLGWLAWDRGDLPGAEDYFQRAMDIGEERAPDSIEHASNYRALGLVAWKRGNLALAEQYFEGSRQRLEELAPNSLRYAATLQRVGYVAAARGDATLARDYYDRATDIQNEVAPGCLELARSHQAIGQLSEETGDTSAAAESYALALEIRSRLAPGSTAEAASAASLGRVYRQMGQPDQALSMYQRAAAALELQQGTLGGTEEHRTLFRASTMDIYREFVGLLAAVGQTREAFELAERSRARGLRELLATRDLVWNEVPVELETERREVAARYDRVQADLAELSPEADAEKVDELLRTLGELRQRQAEIAERLRAASPRAATLQYPDALDLDAAVRALDPSTVVLMYSVARRETVVFTLESTGKLEAKILPIGEASLRQRVISFRESIAATDSPERFDNLSRDLYESIVAPVAAALDPAERVMIVPDGPLHLLPFAALSREAKNDRGREFLVESKPLHTASSVTVYHELAQARPDDPAARTLVAFGDVSYPQGADDTSSGSELSLAQLTRGYELVPLPGTRAEVDAIETIYGGRATTHLGDSATESQAKQLDTNPSVVHFAAHGLIDERFPLDSAIALSPPTVIEPGEDNGLLQAWEVFESVRLNADLVTLSACQSALGAEIDGEGIVGLTSAFLYSGSRSVLASLWSVTDRSTSELMSRFYEYLESGQPKAEALRAAQMDFIRQPSGESPSDDSERGVGRLGRSVDGGAATFQAPYYWAAFELIGDWR